MTFCKCFFRYFIFSVLLLLIAAISAGCGGSSDTEYAEPSANEVAFEEEAVSDDEVSDETPDNTSRTPTLGQMITAGAASRDFPDAPERAWIPHRPRGERSMAASAALFFYDEKDFFDLFGDRELTPFYAPEDYYVFDFVFDPEIKEYSFRYGNFYDEIYLSFDRDVFRQVTITVNGVEIIEGEHDDMPEFAIPLQSGVPAVVQISTVDHNGDAQIYTVTIYTDPFEYTQWTTRPALMGTFIQPWDSGGPSRFTDEEWDEHLQMLLRAGIDTIILQWAARTDRNGNITAVFFQSDYADANGNPPSAVHSRYMLERLLRSATKHGMRVYIGSIIEEDGWWAGAFLDPAWREIQNRVGNIILQEVYDRYKEAFPEAFAGWYWAWEMYTHRNINYNIAWAEMFSANTLWLDEIDKHNMPIMISPFHSQFSGRTPLDAYHQWSDFFVRAHWRDGDIFAAQDSVGAGGGRASLPKANALAKAMAVAVKNAPVSLDYWVNVENFTESQDGSPVFTIEPADIERFIKQLEIAGRYTHNIITYSYSHFFNGNGSPAERLADAAYRHYIGAP